MTTTAEIAAAILKCHFKSGRSADGPISVKGRPHVKDRFHRHRRRSRLRVHNLTLGTAGRRARRVRAKKAAGCMRVRRHSRPAIDPSQRTASPAVPALIGSGSPLCRLLQIGDLLKLCQNAGMMLRQVAHDARIAEQAADVAHGQDQIEVIGPIAGLDRPKVSLQIF